MAIANYSKSCAKNVPGLTALYLVEVDNISSITVTSGEISAITMTDTDTFMEFDVDIDQLALRTEGQGKENFFQTNTIEARFSKLSADLVSAKSALADAIVCGMAAIVTDGNGTSWLVGYNENELDKRPINRMEANFDSGKKPSDEDTAAYVITLMQESGYDPTPFDTTNNGTISGGTATFINYN